MKASDQEHAKWEALMAEGLKAFKSAHFEAARQRYEIAVRLAEGFGPQDVRLGLALYRLGWMLYIKRPCRKDPTELPRALAILEKTLSSDDPELISCLQMLIAQCGRCGDRTRQEEAQKRLLDILERVRGPAHEEVFQLVADLGFNLESQKKYSEAEQLYTRCLKSIEDAVEKAGGSDDPRAIRMLERLAQLYVTQGKDQQAELLFLRVFQARIRSMSRSDVPLEKRMDAMADVGNLSNVVLKFLDQFEPQDLRLARGLLCLGNRTYHKGHVRDPILLRGLLLLDRHFSPGNPESIDCLGILTRFNRNQILSAEVQTKLLTFLARQDVPPEPALHLIDSLGYGLGRSADVERFYRLWLERTEKAWGHDDPRVANVAGALAYHYFLEKEYPRAETLYQHLLTTAEKLHGPRSEKAVRPLYFLGLIARDQHRYSDAENYLRRAIEIDEDDENALSNLAYVLRESGRFKEAAGFQARADEISARLDD